MNDQKRLKTFNTTGFRPEGIEYVQRLQTEDDYHQKRVGRENKKSEKKKRRSKKEGVCAIYRIIHDSHSICLCAFARKE